MNTLEYSRDELAGHFSTLFNDKTADLLTRNISMDGQQNTISKKEIRRAIRGMSSEQKALARGYSQMINSHDKALVVFGNKNDILPKEGLITERERKRSEGKTFGDLGDKNGGGATLHSDGTIQSEYSTAVFIQSDAKFSELSVAVLDESGHSGKWTSGRYSSFKEKGVDKAEVVAHETLGHGLFGGFLKNTEGTENIRSIQISNLVRKHIGGQSMRSGEDHEIDSTETSPGSGRHKPRANVTATPERLKRN